jgi:hypothetical protein
VVLDLLSAVGVVADVRVQAVMWGSRVVTTALMDACPNPYPRLVEPRLERNYQGLGNRLIQRRRTALPAGAVVCRRQRLGGMLSFYDGVAL